MRDTDDIEYYRVPLARGSEDSVSSTSGLLATLRAKLNYLNPKKAFQIARVLLEDSKTVSNENNVKQRGKSILVYIGFVVLALSLNSFYVLLNFNSSITESVVAIEKFGLLMMSILNIAEVVLILIYLALRSWLNRVLRVHSILGSDGLSLKAKVLLFLKRITLGIMFLLPMLFASYILYGVFVWFY